MAFAFDELFAYGGQLIVAAKKRVPKALGLGEEKIDHSAYIEGNTQIGKVDAFSSASATLMVGREGTKGTDRSLHVRGNTRLEGDGGTANALNISGNTTQKGNTNQTGNIDLKGNITISGTMKSGFATWSSSIVATSKLFDIKHPSKDGYRLAHSCLEGPEHAVYYRGRATKNIIPLPLYWKDLVDPASITVSITPIGVHQNIIVKRLDAENIYLQNQGALPINCFFHVFGQRIDIKRLQVEYEGDVDNSPNNI
jgi:hypothetical protein